MFYVRTLQYFRRDDKIQSHFFNRTDGSLIIIGSRALLKKLVFEKTRNTNGTIDQIGFHWKTNSAVLNELQFSDLFFVPLQIASNDDGWILFSNNEYNNKAGRVMIRKKVIRPFIVRHQLVNSEGSEYDIDFDIRNIEFEINGEPGNFLGEHMWISGDNPSTLSEHRRLQEYETEDADQLATQRVRTETEEEEEENVFVSEFEDFSGLEGDLDALIAFNEYSTDQHTRETDIKEPDDELVTIIAISSKSTEDDLDHISFYKILKLDEVTYELYEYGPDVIQTKIIPSLHDADDKVNNRALLGP